MHTEMFPFFFSQDQNMERSALSTSTHLPTVTGQKATDVPNAKHSKTISQAPKLKTMALEAEFKSNIGVLFFCSTFQNFKPLQSSFMSAHIHGGQAF